MVLVIIKFTIATNRLSDQKEEREREPRAERFVDDNKICIDEQVPYIKEDLNI